MSKRVIVVIVEGNSDETLLMEKLREKYRDHEIRFEVQHGDILYDSSTSRPIKNIIGDKVIAIMSKRKYRVKDIIAVLHIMDTDGCMIPHDAVVIGEVHNAKIYYEEEQIVVCDSGQKHTIEKRNRQRSINIKTMNSITSIVGNKYKYQLYYFSRNLEHVLFDEPNPEKEAKSDNVEDFIEALGQPIEEYLETFFPPIEGSDYNLKYRSSWTFITKDRNSLKRFTNVPLLFEYIDKSV